jgi:hypothetical protein
MFEIKYLPECSILIIIIEYISMRSPLFAKQRGEGGEYIKEILTDPPFGRELSKAKFTIYKMHIKIRPIDW